MKHPSTPEVSNRAQVLWAVAALIYPLAFTYVYFVAVAEARQLVQQSVYATGKTLQFVLPLVCLFALKRSWPRFSRPSGDGMALGAAFGLLAVGGTAALTWAWLLPHGYLAEPAAAIQSKIASFGIHTPLAYVMLSVFYALLHSLLEEYYWRWFAFGELRRLAPLWIAIVVSSLAFTAHHLLVVASYFGWLSPLTWLMAGGVAVGGAFWAWLYHRTGTLWAPWLSHLIVDIGVFALGYQMMAGLFR